MGKYGVFSELFYNWSSERRAAKKSTGDGPLKALFKDRQYPLHKDSWDAFWATIIGFLIAAVIWFWPDVHDILTGAREFGAIGDGEMIGYGVAAIPFFSGYYFFVLTVPTRAEKGEHYTKGIFSIVFSVGFFICLLAFFEWFHVESL